MKLWSLKLIDNTEMDMPESAAVLLKAAMARGDKFVNLPDRTIALHQIKTLDKTSREDTEGKKLLEGGLNAFSGQVQVFEDERGYHYVKGITVKKEVGQREYTNYYGKHPAYKKEAGDGYLVSFTVAKDLGVPEGCQLV